MPINERIRDLCAKLITAQGDEYDRLVRELNKMFEELEKSEYKEKADPAEAP